jgi:hypothetical protein
MRRTCIHVCVCVCVCYSSYCQPRPIQFDKYGQPTRRSHCAVKYRVLILFYSFFFFSTHYRYCCIDKRHYSISHFFLLCIFFFFEILFLFSLLSVWFFIFLFSECDIFQFRGFFILSPHNVVAPTVSSHESITEIS